MRKYLLLLLACCLMALPAHADQQVEELFAKAKSVNPELQDYSADMNLVLDAKVAFVPYKPNLNGTYYFKKPDKSKVKLEKAPSFLKKYPGIYGFHLPVLEKYNSHVLGQEKLNGLDCYHVELIPKVMKSDVRRLDIWIDVANFTVPRHQTTYASDGLLTVDSEFQKVDGFMVLKGMRALIRFPKASIEATARATYANYKFNQNLPDSLFSKEG